MRSIYKCPICGHEEEFFDENVRFSQPCCKKCFSSMNFDEDVYTHHESANEDYFECMNDYYDGLMEI